MISIINKVVVDSGIFIGAKHKPDERHLKSVSVLNAFAEGKVREIYITDYVLLETVNFLLRKAGYNAALEAYNYLQNTGRIKIVYVDEIRMVAIKGLFERYKDLSLTDCSLIALVDELKIKTLFSFDRMFDRVKDIGRFEEFSGEA